MRQVALGNGLHLANEVDILIGDNHNLHNETGLRLFNYLAYTATISELCIADFMKLDAVHWNIGAF
jgi:hypothetical protein